LAALSASLAFTAALAFVLVTWQWRRAEDKAISATIAHREAARGQAQLAIDHGRALCERGEIGRGLGWLARSLGLAAEAGDETLDRAARINLADWSARLGRPLATLRVPGPALDLAFRPDGRTFVALGDGGSLRCWDADGWREVGRPFSQDIHDPKGKLFGPIVFDPSQGGSPVIFDHKGRGHTWDIDRGVLIGTTLTTPAPSKTPGADGGRCRGDDKAPRSRGAPVVSPNGRLRATGGDDGRVVVREMATGCAIGADSPLGSPAREFAFIGDGRRLLVVTRDGRAHVWEPESSRVADLPSEDSSVTSLAVSQGGERFATGTEGGDIRLWNSNTLLPEGRTFKVVVAVRCLTFRPDGQALAVGLRDGTIRVWEVPRSGPIAPPLPGQGPVRTLAFSRSGAHLLTADDHGLE